MITVEYTWLEVSKLFTRLAWISVCHIPRHGDLDSGSEVDSDNALISYHLPSVVDCPVVGGSKEDVSNETSPLHVLTVERPEATESGWAAHNRVLLD